MCFKEKRDFPRESGWIVEARGKKIQYYKYVTLKVFE